MTAEPSAGAARHDRLRVLLVEDEPQVRKVAMRVLNAAGFDVEVAEGGSLGLETVRARNGEFDVVLSDIMMPGVDGIEFAVRARSEYPGLRFVFMTGFADISRDRERAAGLCEAIVGKPFDMNELAATLRAAAGRSGS